MNILLMLAHSIEEYDQLRLLTGLGHDVWSIGAYIDPSSPLDDMRPPLPETFHHPELKALVEALPVTSERPDRLWNAKAALPLGIIEWADVIICHHIEWDWLWPQWSRIKHKRIIWRTVGQSSHVNEWRAQPYVREGCEVVRYSPRERALPNFAGESALIRFWKDPDEWHGWTGTAEHVLAVTQGPKGRGRDGSWVNLEWLMSATRDLPVRWVGPGTESLGGMGKVPLDVLKGEMRAARCALYTGTQPASYTLALIEMMMTGVPVVSIDASHMRLFPYSPALFEGHRIAPLWAVNAADARDLLSGLLADHREAERVSAVSRARAIALFSRDRAERAWGGWLDDRTVPEPDPEDLPDVADA